MYSIFIEFEKNSKVTVELRKSSLEKLDLSFMNILENEVLHISKSKVRTEIWKCQSIKVVPLRI